MRILASNAWIELYQPNPSARLRLFCFPYAGGSARIYRSWARHLPSAVEVCPVQLPGRDRRIAEPPFTNIQLLVKAAFAALQPLFDKPFAFFGHSMGALIGFELAHYVQAELGVSPQHIFASGRRAPQVGKEQSIYDLPKDELLAELQQLKGTPPDVLEHPDLMELMLPLLRADFSLGDTYVFPVSRPLLSCPITVLGGLLDHHESRAELQAWGELTSGPFSLRMFPGDHFFVHSDELRLLEVIGRVLQQTCDTL